MSDRIVNVS